MATIRKRGNKFQAQVRRNGFQGVSKSFEKLTEAKAWARQIEIGFDRGETPLSEKQKANTFADIAKRYLKEVSPSKKSYLLLSFTACFARTFGESSILCHLFTNVLVRVAS